MAEKKKVQLVVDSAAANEGVPPPKAFDFSAFQQQFYDDAATASGGGGGARPTPSDTTESGGLYHTSYQCRKSSIVAGMSSEQLVDEHRKSIAGFSMKENGRPVDMGDLNGITLSKRHTLSQIEYEAELDSGAYKDFDGFRFGEQLSESDRAAADAAGQ